MPTPHARRLRFARFDFQSREEAGAIAQYVASMLPDPVRAEFVLTELMINAVEHGNLEIKAAKVGLVRSGELEAEVARRRLDPQYRDRVAWLELHRQPNEATFVIGDEGPGFCWQHAPGLGSGELPCGRGIALARAMSSGLQFNPEGNIVTVSLQW